jgi:hypothetical protein
MSLVMLDTVPAGVRELASSRQWLEKLTTGHPEVGIRLVSASYPDMRPAWARLCEHGDPEVPTFFFHFALELPAMWDRLPKAGRKQYQASIAGIAAAAEELAKSLQLLESEITFSRGSRLTFHHVAVRARTIEQERAGQVTAPGPWEYALGDEGREASALSNFLNALAHELRPPHTPRETAIRPRRAAAATAARTYMVRSLAVFLHGAYGSPLFDVVAATVNTIMDDAVTSLDANHALKLASGLF